MFRKILVAYNGTPELRPALNEVVRIAPQRSVEVHLAGVIHYSAYSVAAVEWVPNLALADAREQMKADLKAAREMLTRQGFNVVEHLVVGEPLDILTKLVELHGIDLLILGHLRTKSFALRWGRGSSNKLLMEHVRCSILIAADLNQI